MTLHLKYPLILASQSPRRKQLLQESGFVFTTLASNIDETIRPEWQLEDTAVKLAIEKAEAITPMYAETTSIILASDTVVVLDNTILGKPADKAEAKKMLKAMSGRVHEVHTGVAFRGVFAEEFRVVSRVEFDILSDAEIEYYIESYAPYDKAGSYGVQEWLGHCKIKWLEGSFTNVMGLPMHEVYNAQIEMVGNNLFVPGDAIFIHPSTIVLGDARKPNSIGQKLGLVGYYRIVEVDSFIEGGVYKTTLRANWEASGDGISRYNTDQNAPLKNKLCNDANTPTVKDTINLREIYSRENIQIVSPSSETNSSYCAEVAKLGSEKRADAQRRA
jgi:septum formation protein